MTRLNPTIRTILESVIDWTEDDRDKMEVLINEAKVKGKKLPLFNSFLFCIEQFEALIKQDNSYDIEMQTQREELRARDRERKRAERLASKEAKLNEDQSILNEEQAREMEWNRLSEEEKVIKATEEGWTYIAKVEVIEEKEDFRNGPKRTNRNSLNQTTEDMI